MRRQKVKNRGERVDNSGMVFGELGRKKGGRRRRRRGRITDIEEIHKRERKKTRVQEGERERKDWEVIKVHFNFQVKAH